MFIHNLNPVALEIFFFKIHWYSLAYIFGIIFGWLYCKNILIKDKSLNDTFDDLINYIVLGIIIGGRLGYVVFYNFEYYFQNILEIFMIWEGGMSFHGGLIGVIISTYIFSKKRKIDKFIFLDLISLVAPIGIFFGRIANFINSELYGRETDLFWGVKFPKVDDLYRHPSQIYEAIFEGVFLFIILNFLHMKDKFKTPGLISSMFLIFYSLFRIFTEIFREPDNQIGYILFHFSLGQLISFVFLIFGFFLYFKKHEKE